MTITQTGPALTELLITVATFLGLIAAVYAGVPCNARLAPLNLPEGTLEIVGQTANIFLVATSVVLGLMLNSAKTTFETNDRNVHALATELILLDRSVRGLGPGADETHRRLVDYVQSALKQPHILEPNTDAETMLDSAGASLRSIRTWTSRYWPGGTMHGKSFVRSCAFVGLASTPPAVRSRRRWSSC